MGCTLGRPGLMETGASRWNFPRPSGCNVNRYHFLLHVVWVLALICKLGWMRRRRVGKDLSFWTKTAKFLSFFPFWPLTERWQCWTEYRIYREKEKQIGAWCSRCFTLFSICSILAHLKPFHSMMMRTDPFNFGKLRAFQTGSSSNFTTR